MRERKIDLPPAVQTYTTALGSLLGSVRRDQQEFSRFDEGGAVALIYGAWQAAIERHWPPDRKLTPVVMALRNFLEQVEREEKTRGKAEVIQ